MFLYQNLTNLASFLHISKLCTYLYDFDFIPVDFQYQGLHISSSLFCPFLRLKFLQAKRYVRKNNRNFNRPSFSMHKWALWAEPSLSLPIDTRASWSRLEKNYWGDAQDKSH